MSIASVVVEIQPDTSQAVLARLALIPEVSVYGVTENQIVTVVEGKAAGSIEETLKAIQVLDDVIGVFPVFVGEDD